MKPVPFRTRANRARAAISRSASLAVLAFTVTATAQPRIDVAAIDRARILKAADAALRQEPVTITKFRAKLSQGGPHDFYSNGDYWWPNTNKPDGLPYIELDGKSNPGNFNLHRQAVKTLHLSVAALGAAYKITGDDRYAAKAAVLLRVFFVDPDTRMNPSLDYAQAVPGVTPGRSAGIIDSLQIIEVPRAIQTMSHAPAMSPKLLAELKQWFRDYSNWMLTSANGRKEAAAKNNHAVAFSLQIAAFAAFTGDQEQLAQCRRQFKDIFVSRQMAPDGSFPAELARTKPYGYSIFQLDNLATLAQILSTPADDLWKFEGPDGRSLRKAVDYLFPFLADKSKWPKPPDIQAWNGWPARQPHLLFAGLAYADERYLELWKKLPADPEDPEVQRNIAITQPILWIKFPGEAPTD